LDLADTLLFMPDLFNYYLSGEMLCEYSIASTSQLLNARTKEWDKAILKKLNIRDDLLKDPVPSGTPAGKLTKDMCQATGLRDVKIIATAGHDTAKRRFGGTVFQKGLCVYQFRNVVAVGHRMSGAGDQ
jgi:rhamnulokinase